MWISLLTSPIFSLTTEVFSLHLGRRNDFSNFGLHLNDKSNLSMRVAECTVLISITICNEAIELHNYLPLIFIYLSDFFFF